MNKMFYLIGGAPRSGKTTIAKGLSKKLGVPWISTDTLESVVMEYVADGEFDTLFPKNVLRKLTNQSNDEMYQKYTPEQIVEAYIQQGKSLNQAIEAFVECEASYNHSYIIEGYHISPELVLMLEKKFEIRTFFTGREDLTETLEAITKNSGENDWVISKTKNTKTYALIAKMLTIFSSQLKKEAEANGYDYFSMESDFKENVQRVVGSFQ